MKNFKTIIAILAISITSILPASANTDTELITKAKTILRTEIVNLLGNHEYDLKNQVLEAQVFIMLNNQNELIVVDVKSDNKTVSKFVKEKLNYKKVSVKGIKKGTVYRMSLKMISNS